MPRFNFEVEREVKRPRYRRDKIMRTTVLFCIVAAVTTAVIYAIVPDDSTNDQEQKAGKENIPAAVEKNSAASDTGSKTADPVNRDTPGETATGISGESGEPGGSVPDPAGDGKMENSVSVSGNNDAKYDPPAPELAVHTKMFRQALQDGSWKQAKYAVTHTVQGGDTLGLLTAKYKNTRHFVRKYNHIDNPDSIRIGQKITFIKADSWQLVISRKSGTLQLNRVTGDSQVPFVLFPIRTLPGVLRDDLVVCSRIAKPIFRDAHGRVFPNGSEGNPYGDFLITLAGKKRPDAPILHLSIHGSGSQAAAENSLRSGAVQLNNEDISLLYSLIPEGSPVRIVE